MLSRTLRASGLVYRRFGHNLSRPAWSRTFATPSNNFPNPKKNSNNNNNNNQQLQDKGKEKESKEEVSQEAKDDKQEPLKGLEGFFQRYHQQQQSQQSQHRKEESSRSEDPEQPSKPPPPPPRRRREQQWVQCKPTRHPRDHSRHFLCSLKHGFPLVPRNNMARI